MLIVGQSILDRSLLKGVNRGSLKSGGYYLRIHKILPYVGEDGAESDFSPVASHVLKPGASAWIVSEEIFQISDPSITALVTLRSSFTKKGMMALDVGLVDANYTGPIGTVVINISKNNILLSSGEEFFRVIFMEHDPVDEEFQYNVRSYDHTTYINERVGEIVRDFPGTFLQMGDIEKRLSESLSAGNIAKELEKSIVDAVVVGVVRQHWLKVGILLVFLVFAILYIGSDFLGISGNDVRDAARGWLNIAEPETTRPADG